MISQQLEAQLVFQDSLLSYRKGTAVSIVQVDLKLMASSASLSAGITGTPSCPIIGHFYCNYLESQM